ncbi:MAG: hypothetical protein CSA81_04250 [Acidobacteria bacterium]|nr:MAG: hypothetical protein CSA81_04250 [Acidobacteriota bacterium]
MRSIEDTIQKIKSLPVLPDMAHKILQIADDPNVSIVRLAEEIQKDAAITVRVLEVVNSSFYALRQEVTSVQQAITLLGVQHVRNLVMTLIVINRFRDTPDALLRLSDFWNHSLGVALISQVFAKKMGYKKHAELYLAGLLHDIGKLVLQAYYPEDLQHVKQYLDEHGGSMYDAEKAVLGFSHADLGAGMAQKWKLPQILQMGIQYHHDCVESPDVLFSALLQASNQLTQSRLYAVCGDQNIDVVFADEPCWKIIFNTYKSSMDMERFLLEMDDEIEKAKELVQSARS